MNLDRALRDAAEQVPARVAEPAAQALLDRIVAASAPVGPAAAGRRAAGRRAAIAVLAAAAAITAAITVPHLGSDPAYASWTPQPGPLADADRTGLADRCVAQTGTEYDVGEPKPAARVVQAERRGAYAAVSVITPGWSASCFRDQDGTLRQASIRMEPVSTVRLGGTGVDLLSWPQLRTAEGYCRLMSGHVGSQVVGVDIVLPAGAGDRTVRTTVAGGYFLAWYPERLAASATGTTSLTLRLATGGTVAGLSARDLMEAPRLN